MSIILIALNERDVPDDLRRRAQELCPDASLLITDDREEIEAHLDEIEVAAARFPIQWIPRAEKLRWFQQWGAGTDWLLRHPEIALLDFKLTNASGVHAIPISEHIFAFMFAFARRLPEAMQAQALRRWDRQENNPAFEIAGKTMLLVGVGAIGRRTAQMASALGMRVLGVRNDPAKTVPGVERMVGPDKMLELVPEADFIVLTIPLTEQTRGIVDGQFFDAMKSSAYLINIGRGGTVDENAMIESLLTKKIAGAGLDVFETEPLPETSPLWTMPNVIITGHYSGETPHYNERALGIFLDNLERYARGLELRNLVDKKKGY